MEDTYIIPKPGPWLEAELTNDEALDIIKLTEIVSDKSLKMRFSAEEIFEQAAPYLKAYIHFSYRNAMKNFKWHQTPAADTTGFDTLTGEQQFAIRYLFYFPIAARSVETIAEILRQKTNVVSIASASPKNYWRTTSLESRMFFQGDMPAFTPSEKGSIKDGDLIQVPAGSIKKGSEKIELTNKIGISFARLEQEGIHIAHLKPEDEIYHNAMLSLWKEGNALVSVPQIYRAAVKNKNKKPTETEAQNIIESIERMRKTDVFYDNRTSATEYGQPEFRVTSNLIYAEIFAGSISAEGNTPDKDCVIINGKIVKYCVHFIGDCPFPVYKWAEAKNQIQSYPMAEIATSINKNQTTLVLENALLERITTIKTHKDEPKISKKIIYENLFESARLLTQPDGKPYKALSKRKAQLKKYTRMILNDFVKNLFIKSYTEEKTGNAVTGAKIKP